MEENNGQWFRYEPTDKNRENQDERMHVRNISRTSGLFSNVPNLSLVDVNMNNEYDELIIGDNKESYKMRVYGNGNQIVKDKRIEFECEPSKKDIVNKLIDRLPL